MNSSIEQREGGARLIRRKFESTKSRENLIREAHLKVDAQIKTAHEDLLKTVVLALEEGYSVTFIAESAGVARGTVYGWIEQAKQEEGNKDG